MMRPAFTTMDRNPCKRAVRGERPEDEPGSMNGERLRKQLRGKRVTVLGLGTFGGGLAALRFLVDAGAFVTATDLRSADQLGLNLRSPEWSNVTWRLGGHDERDVTQADLVVVNPAVPPSSPLLQLARERGVPLTTEIALFWQCNPARVVAVTGSNGKSTTTALVHAALEASGRRTWLGGNIGKSLLEGVDAIGPDDWVVLELSSFQLVYLDQLRARPDIAVVTNFSPNHLDWHGTVDAYREAKQSLLRWQTERDVAVLNQDDMDVAGWPTTAQRLWFGTVDTGRPGVFGGPADDHFVIRLPAARRSVEKSVSLQDWLRLPGRHNLANAAAATCAALAAGVDVEAVRRGFQAFHGLPHRLQFVAEVAGRRFYNDSLATTPESAIEALYAFDQKVVLLAGGYDKHVDLKHFAAAVAERTKAVALMGQTGPTLERLIGEQPTAAPRAKLARTFEEAFEWAVEQSEPGDVVLLSPGCASYDWFANFVERGERFCEAVRRLQQRGGPGATEEPEDGGEPNSPPGST